METYVIKRDGKKEKFDINKIMKAVTKSTNNNLKYDSGKFSEEIINHINDLDEISVESIHVLIVDTLKKMEYKEIAENYDSYRKDRDKIRANKLDIMKTIKAIGNECDKDNANVGTNFSAKLLRIASEANKWAVLSEMPKDMAKLHENADLHYHDLDSFNLTINCLHIPTAKLLSEGFNTGHGTVRQPQRISSAAALVCIIIQSSQNEMFGGQNAGAIDNILAPYVEKTRVLFRDKYTEIFNLENVDTKNMIDKLVEKEVENEIRQAMQAMIYNLNTMHSRAGSQVPFSSVNIGIPEGDEQTKKDSALICKIFLEEYAKGMGNGEACIFPNIIFRVKDGVNKNEGDPYYNLFKEACASASKRMNPTFLNLDSSTYKPYYEKGLTMELMG